MQKNSKNGYEREVHTSDEGIIFPIIVLLILS